MRDYKAFERGQVRRRVLQERRLGGGREPAEVAARLRARRRARAASPPGRAAVGASSPPACHGARPVPGAAPRPRRRLLAWWDAGHRDLPGGFPGVDANPYRVWLAEVMLQQTRVGRCVPCYRHFLERWSSLESLARADDAEVLAAWSGLGCWPAAGTSLGGAGRSPAAPADPYGSLEALRASPPGFGPYTAGAVASIAFAIPAAAVDGNVPGCSPVSSGWRGDPVLTAKVSRRLTSLAGALRRSRPARRPQPGAHGAGGDRVPSPAAPVSRMSGGVGAARMGRGVGEEFPPRSAAEAPSRWSWRSSGWSGQGTCSSGARRRAGSFQGCGGCPGWSSRRETTPAGYLRRRAEADLGLRISVEGESRR